MTGHLFAPEAKCKYTQADLERAKAFVEANTDGWHCPSDTSIAQLIADVRAEAEAKLSERIRELTDGLEAHDLHIGMASKARDAAIRGGRYAWLAEMLDQARAEAAETERDRNGQHACIAERLAREERQRAEAAEKKLSGATIALQSWIEKNMQSECARADARRWAKRWKALAKKLQQDYSDLDATTLGTSDQIEMLRHHAKRWKALAKHYHNAFRATR